MTRFTGIIRALVLSGTLLTALLCSAVQAAPPEDELHQAWDALLHRFVKPINQGHSSAVDYAGLQTRAAQLDAYLARLATITPDVFAQWPANEQLAFLINAYNAHTVALILTRYPEIDSIRELGSWFASPWKQAIAPLLGETRTLDNIEHELIRGNNKYQEPRIHFAVNCASVGCPALRNEAYTGAKLEQQLDAQTRAFLADNTRNRLSGNTLKLSKIFAWYGEDFALGWRGNHSLAEFLLYYSQALGLSQQQQQALLTGDIAIDFNEYDWTLNDIE